MRAALLIVSLLAPAPVVFAQLESDTLTILASRSFRPSPDQVVFQLQLATNLNAGFGDVVAALPGLGITAANLLDIQGRSSDSIASWFFNLTVPFKNLKTTAAVLRKLQQTISQNNNGMMLLFTVLGSQVSPEAMQSQTCSVPDLVADARLQADKLATAAGLIAGPILAMSDGNSGEPAPAVATFELFPIVDPVTGMEVYPTVPTILTRGAPDPFRCTAEIKFKLLRYQ